MPKRNGQRQKKEAHKLFEKGVQHLHKQRIDDGIDLLKQARDLDTRNPDILVNLGGAYLLKGEHKKAVSVLECATNVAPESLNAWINLAAAHLGPLENSTSEQQQKAIEAWQEALRIDDEAPNVNYMLGLVYYKQGAYERAVAHFARAIEVDPNDTDAKRWLSSLTSRKGDDGDVTEGP